jgi:hypothetical protein
MNTYSLLLLMLMTAIPLSAQPADQRNPGPGSHPFGAYSVAATSINGSAAVVTGGGAGWQIDRSLALGAYGYGLINRVKGEPGPGVASQMALGYAGVDTRYILDGDRPYHVAFSVLLGGGIVSYLEGDWRRASEGSRVKEVPDASGHDFVLIVEPGVDLEANVGSDVRVTLGSSFRYISDVGLPGLSSSRLSGLSTRIGLRLGIF